MARFSEEKLFNIKPCVLILSTTFVWNISHFKKNSARYYYKCTYFFMQSTLYTSRILIRFQFSGQIFVNPLKYQILWRLVRREPGYFMRKYWHDEAETPKNLSWSSNKEQYVSPGKFFHPLCRFACQFISSFFSNRLFLLLSIIRQ